MNDTKTEWPKGTLAFNAGASALLSWLYGGDVLDAVRSATAEVSVLGQAPNLSFAAPALLATLVGAGLTLWGVRQRRGGAWKGYRVLPMVAVLVLFVDLFVLGAQKLPIGAADRIALAIQALAHRAHEAATGTSVPSSPKELQAMVAELGEPPVWRKGTPLAAWALEVRRDCQGPATDRAGAEAGTLIYCVAPGAARAWVTAVALPREDRFGSAAMFSVDGQSLSAPVLPLLPEQDPGPDEALPGEDGAPFAPPALGDDAPAFAPPARGDDRPPFAPPVRDDGVPRNAPPATGHDRPPAAPP